jgi:putative membrane protein
LNYQDILKQKENNITRIDETIKFLRENFDGLDKYDSKYGQLIVLLNKEKRLYSNLDKSDSDVFYNELREIKRQISFKISEIKSKKTEVFEELSHKNKIQSSEKVLEKNIRNIEKELCENKYFRYYLSGQKHKECIINNFSLFLKETFSNCKFIDTKQGIILTLLDEERKCNDISKIIRIKNVIAYQILEIKKEISNSFCEESIKDKFAKAKISDEYIINKKKELQNKEALRIKNKLLSDEYFEYYLTNSFEERSVKDYFNALLKFHPLILSSISLVSVICFFVYYGLFIGYFPALSGSDVFYFGGLIFSIIFVISIITILPIFFYPEYCKTKKNIKLILTISMPSILIYIYLVFIADLSIYWAIFTAVIICIITFFLVYGAFKTKDYICDNLLNQISTIIVIFVVIISLEILKNHMPCKIIKLIVNLLSISFLMSFVIPLGFLFYMQGFYKVGGYKFILISFIIITPLYLFVKLTGNIANSLEIANVEYQYLTIEKNALGVLPENICKNGKYCDDSKTYYDKNETSGVTKLYNIKALSTLGKFYYLETKDGVKFELDASKIISREKQER